MMLAMIRAIKDFRQMKSGLRLTHCTPEELDSLLHYSSVQRDEMTAFCQSVRKEIDRRSAATQSRRFARNIGRPA